VAVGALALLLGACGEDVGPEVSSEEINLFIWREYTPPELISAFEREYDVTANVSYYLMGSTAERVVRHADVPVYVFR
jgi:spermidine/putrescine-binding protein